MMKSSWDSLSREEGGKSAGGDEDTTMFAQVFTDKSVNFRT